MVAPSLADSDFSEGSSSERFRRLVGQLVQAALNDLSQIEALDDSLAPQEPGKFDRRTAALLREEYERWAASATLLLERIDRFASLADPVAGTEILRHAYGKTRARLSISLDDMEQSLLALANGKVVKGEEVRRDLQLRIH